MNPRIFFGELKRRNVYKVAVAYAVVSWLLIQIATQVFPFFEIPSWAVRLVVLLLILGFPVALILSWAFEITPEGIKRESEVAPNEAITRHTGRKIVGITIVLAVIAAGLLAFQLLRPKSTTTVNSSASVALASATAPPVILEKSIAVLPFVNMSSDRENEYFVDGLTEEILNRLAQISALRVPGRTSSFAFKDKNSDLRQIGTELSVAHVLEGSVRKSGDRLRITAELIRTADGFHLWSQSFDRNLGDVFAVQEEIARAIADALSTPLGLGETASPQRQTKDMEAYGDFLQARALLADRTPDKLHRALQLLTAAVEQDPNFASGWAALAQARALSLYYLADVPEPLQGAEEAARKALALDDSIAMAHSALADVLRDRHDWVAAETEYQHALKLSPGEAETHNQYAQMLLKLGRMEGALQHGLRACELDPLAWVPQSVVSLVYLSRGDHVNGRAFLDRSEKLRGQVGGFHTRLELLYALSQQDRDLGRRALRLALERPEETWSAYPPSPQFINVMDQALATFPGSSAGPTDLAKASKEIRASGHQDRGLPLSAVAVFVGQKEAALDALFVEAETPGNDIVAIIWTPVYRPLRSEPRFLEFLRTMKMPEYWRAVGWGEFCRPKGDNDFECTAP